MTLQVLDSQLRPLPPEEAERSLLGRTPRFDLILWRSTWRGMRQVAVAPCWLPHLPREGESMTAVKPTVFVGPLRATHWTVIDTAQGGLTVNAGGHCSGDFPRLRRGDTLSLCPTIGAEAQA